MIAKYSRKSLMWGLPGLLIQVGCSLASNLIAAKITVNGPPPPMALVGILELGILVGGILLIIGLGYYAKAKGYSAALGLLGLLSCIGLLILAVLPDKTKGKNDHSLS